MAEPRTSFGAGLLKRERLRASAIVVCWGLLTYSLFSQILFAKAQIESYDMLLLFGVNVLAGLVLADAAQAILGYFVSMAIGLSLFFYTATFPVPVATEFEAGAVQSLWIVILTNQMIPFGFIILFFGSTIGAALAEKFL